MARVTIMDVPVDALTGAEAVARIRAMLGGGQHHVMTPNAEMLVEASRNPPFFEVLRHSALNLADGIGLVWMSRLLGRPLPERVTGVDTVAALCAELDERQTVFLLGGVPGVAERAAAALRARNPRLTIAGTHAGLPGPDEAPGIVAGIRTAAPALLLVAFGAPKQDLWIAAHLDALPSVRVAMGVGGTFDFLAGVQRRAPAPLRRLGLEWAWRLVRQPKRIFRIFTAVIVFPLLTLRWSLRSGAAARRAPRTTPGRPS